MCCRFTSQIAQVCPIKKKITMTGVLVSMLAARCGRLAANGPFTARRVQTRSSSSTLPAAHSMLCRTACQLFFFLFFFFAQAAHFVRLISSRPASFLFWSPPSCQLVTAGPSPFFFLASVRLPPAVWSPPFAPPLVCQLAAHP